MSASLWVAMTDVRSMARGTAGGTLVPDLDRHNGALDAVGHLVAELRQPGPELLGAGGHRLSAPVLDLGDTGRLEGGGQGCRHP